MDDTPAQSSSGGIRFLDDDQSSDTVRFLDDEPIEKGSNNVFEKITNFIDTMREQRKQKAIAEAQAAKEEQERRENDPRFMSSSQMKKKLPTPKTPEEKAIFDAMLESKREEEKRLKEQIKPPKQELPAEIGPDTPGAVRLPSGNYGIPLNAPERKQLPRDIAAEPGEVIKGPSRDIRDVPSAFGAGAAQGALGIIESVLRTPEAVERALGGIGDLIGAPKTREQLKPLYDPITEGFEVFGHSVPGLNDLADKIHVAQATLAETRSAFKRNALLAQQADKAFENLINTGNIEDIGEVISNPVAWSGFIGQAVPSLASAYLAGGRIAFMMWLEAMDTANNAAEFEKETGVKMTDQEFLKATSQAGIINGILEKVGFDKVFGPLKGSQAGKKIFGGALTQPNFLKAVLGKAGAESFTEALQAFNSNAAARNFNEDQKLIEGILSSAMGGFGAGAFGGSFALKVGQMSADEQKARAKKFAASLKESEVTKPQKPVEIKVPKEVKKEVQKETQSAETEQIRFLDEQTTPKSEQKPTIDETAQIPVQGFPEKASAPEQVIKKTTVEPPTPPEDGNVYNPWEMPMRVEKPSGAVKSVSAPAIMNQLAKTMETFGGKVPIRSGRMGAMARKALGFFVPTIEVIRIKTANDILTASHELGHALEKIVLGWPKGGPWSSPRVNAKMQGELLRMGKILYGKRTPAGGYKREGFAEFVKLWLTDREMAKKQAPTFYEYFDTQFLKDFPEGREELDRAQDMFRRWQLQGAQGRAKASVVDTGSIEQIAKRIKAGAKNYLSFEKHIDMLRPIHDITKQAEKKLGQRLSPGEDPWFIGSALRTTHDARTRYMVEEAMIDIAGNPVGRPLADIRPLVKGRKDDFTIYLWAKRALALWNEEKARNPGLTKEDAETIVAELESSEFQRAAQMVYDWNDGVLNYASQSSPTFRQVVDKIRESDPGYYIPLKREFDNLDSKYLKAKGGGSKAASGSLTQRLKGSGRRITDPFPNMIAKARSTLLAAHNRMVLDSIVKLSKIEGMGHLIEEVPRDMVPVAKQTVDQVIDTLNRELEDDQKINKDFDRDVLSQSITFFAPAQRPKGSDPIFPIVDEGKIRWFQLDGELYDGLQAMEIYRLPSIAGMPILDWLFAKPVRLFRAGTTGLRPTFGLLTNPMRDVQTLYMNSQSSANSGLLFQAWMKSMSDAFLHKTVGKKNPFLDTFIRLGGEMAQPLGQDIPQTRRAARTLFEGRLLRTVDPRNWFDFMRDFLQFPESASRVAELRTLAKDIGYEPGMPMTFDQSLKLLLAAKQVTTDFTAAGEFSRVINQMVPFYNSQIQGPRANIRAGMRNPRKFFGRGLALSAATLLLWAANRDRDWYRELNAKEKFMYWYFEVNMTGPDGKERKELIRLPRAFEVGQVFSALPEALIDSAYRQNPEAANEWAQTFVELINPAGLPVVFDEVLEQARNRDLFWDSPIVSQRLLKRPQAEQYDEFTSRAAIKIGEFFNVSPERVDHALRGMFGTVASDILNVLPIGPEGVERDSEPADTPLAGTLFKRGGEFGSRPRSLERLYETFDKATQKQNSIRNPETDHERDLRLMLMDATQAVSSMSYVRSRTKSADKRRDIMKEEIKLAKEALELYERGEVVRVDFRIAKKDAKREAKELKEQFAERQRRS